MATRPLEREEYIRVIGKCCPYNSMEELNP